LASLHSEGGGGTQVALRSHVWGARDSGGAASDSFVLLLEQLGRNNGSPRSANGSEEKNGRRAVLFMVTPRATNWPRPVYLGIATPPESATGRPVAGLPRAIRGLAWTTRARRASRRESRTVARRLRQRL
jgi:hypothetical protein